MRLSESTTSDPVSCGCPPPVSPVFPLWGTMGVRVSAQIRTTSATSAVLAGRSTIGTRPCHPSRQATQ